MSAVTALERALASGTPLAGGRYVVTRILQWRLAGGLYQVRTADGNTHRVVRELIPPDRMSPVEIDARHSLAESMLTQIEQFRHPRLARVYEHFREGRKLYVVEELLEGGALRQALELTPAASLPTETLHWAEQLLEAMEYLHERPRPYLLGDTLELDHVVVDRHNDLKLVNYGVRRLFSGYATDFLAPSRQEVTSDRRAFANLLWLMLTQHDLTPCLTPRLARLLRACRQSRSRTFRQLLAELRRPEPPRRKRRPPLQLRLWQPLAALLLALLWWAAPWQPRLARPEQECVYVACGSELVGITVSNQRVFTRLRAPVPLTALGVFGQTVWGASPASDLLWGVEGRQHRPLRQAVGPGPDALSELGGGMLLAGLPSSGRIAVLDGRRTVQLAVGRGARWGAADHRRIYVSCPQSNQVAVLGRRPLHVQEPLAVERPGPVAVIGSRLAVSHEGGIRFYQDRELVQQVKCPPVLGLVARPGTDQLWAWHAGGQLTVWDARRGRLVGQLSLPGEVQDTAFVASAGELWVSLPERGQVAVVGASSRTLRTLISVGERPGALARME